MEGLPPIPGYTLKDPTCRDHRLGHKFGFINGYRVLRDSNVGVGGRPIDVASLAFTKKDDSLQYDPSLTYGRVRDYGHQQFVPHYALFAQKCLCFKAFFRQGVFNSPDEHFRIRHVNIIYYLEDDTICVIEPTVMNAGFSQGKLVMRSKIMKTTSGDYFHWKDFNVGVDVCIHGVIYHIVDCDLFTREYLMSQGIDVGDREDPPIDPYTHNRLSKSKIPTIVTKVPDDTRRRFLEYDGMILNFSALWNEDKYEILYFLMDDTIAIRQVHQLNNGKDPVVMLLRKMKVPKNWKHLPSFYPAICMEYGEPEVTEYYTPKDFKVGETIFVFGRRFFLYDCDPFTRKYYSGMLGIVQPERIELPESKEIRMPEVKAPPHIMVGTPEDTYASCLTFRPKAPKKDFIRQLSTFPKKLRYSMHMDAVHPEDRNRDFILEYNLSEGTILINELQKQNSGRHAGCFLKPTLVPKPGTGRDDPLYYTPKDFFIGAKINVFNHYFIIDGADLFVYRYMEANPQKFCQQIKDNIRNYFAQRGLLHDDIIAKAKKIEEEEHNEEVIRGKTSKRKPEIETDNCELTAKDQQKVQELSASVPLQELCPNLADTPVEPSTQ